MFDLISQATQGSFHEWAVPISIAIVWIFSWQLLQHTGMIHDHPKYDPRLRIEIHDAPALEEERPHSLAGRLAKTIRRKESSDEGDGPCTLLL